MNMFSLNMSGINKMCMKTICVSKLWNHLGKGRDQLGYGMSNKKNPWRMDDLLPNPHWVGEALVE